MFYYPTIGCTTFKIRIQKTRTNLFFDNIVVMWLKPITVLDYLSPTLKQWAIEIYYSWHRNLCCDKRELRDYNLAATVDC